MPIEIIDKSKETVDIKHKPVGCWMYVRTDEIDLSDP